VNCRLHTPVCDILGCQYPIVLAGMGGVARSELVAAVTRAGGFGFPGIFPTEERVRRIVTDAEKLMTA
jgi:nitronate monooxygenase